MKWLLNHRTDFAGNGWEQLCGDNMRFGVMGGVSAIYNSSYGASLLMLSQNHFSMMKEPHAADLGNLIRVGIDWRA